MYFYSAFDLPVIVIWSTVALCHSCTTSSLLPAALRLLLWIMATSEFIFCIASVLFSHRAFFCFHTEHCIYFYELRPPVSSYFALLLFCFHTEPTLLLHICLVFFLLSTV